MVEWVAKHVIGVQAELVVQGKPSAEILRVAAEQTADMIVLGTHGKGMLDQALFGSYRLDSIEVVQEQSPGLFTPIFQDCTAHPFNHQDPGDGITLTLATATTNCP